MSRHVIALPALSNTVVIPGSIGAAFGTSSKAASTSPKLTLYTEQVEGFAVIAAARPEVALQLPLNTVEVPSVDP